MNGLNAAQSHPDPRFTKNRKGEITNRASSYANKSKHVANNPSARRGLHGVRQHMCGSAAVSERQKTRCGGRTLHLGRVQHLSASRANIFKTRDESGALENIRPNRTSRKLLGQSGLERSARLCRVYAAAAHLCVGLEG